MKNKNFTKTLIKWYLANKRDLPWRNTNDPYRIWLSEIMLQQTRIAQGLPYYLTFTREYPTIFDLANAPQDDVLKLWQGLGYYSRARNLHSTAKKVAFEMNGVFPNDYQGLLKLKGIGDYTASAIASICYDEPVAVVDGNVYRVLARYFGIVLPINSGEGIKAFKSLAMELIDPKQPGTYNQAIMEFGAMHCSPKLPLCHECTLRTSCFAYAENKVGELPVKLKKQKITIRHFNYLVFLSEENRTLLQQRTSKGIWQGLYEFPLIETEQEVFTEDLILTEDFQKHTHHLDPEIRLYNNKPIKHILSHQHIYAKFWILSTKRLIKSSIHINSLTEYPVPVLLEKFINVFLQSDYD
ncbi:A/G-specific adenine glycosylase [Gangjinia marincola]|uniref:Adenine DNA glycosylase n=1 Tax=Gangjinia marincola TaxID=578463 RepID=A0ABP3XVW6_9FLAO